MLQLGQFYLNLALMALCALGKDVKNQRGAVDHAHFDFFFEIALLRRGQHVVDHHQPGTGLGNCRCQFLHLSTAGK